ncbi:GNAT family N-acetyltransferase [Chitinimonas naiadis]
MPKHAIRPAFLLDIPALLYLYTQFDSEPQPAVEPHSAMLQFESMKNRGEVLVAEVSGQIIGCCSLYICPTLMHGARPFGIIEHIVVDPSHRRQGIGRALLEEAIRIADFRRCYKLMLMTDAVQEGMQRFYEACGFSRGAQGFQRRLEDANR